MWQFALPVLFALFVWWFSTGLIVYLDGLPRRTFRWSLLGGTVVLAGALAGLAWSTTDTSVAGAYCAFTCGVLVWGWLEMGFLMGPLVGPRRTPCPPSATGWHRVGLAIMTILYHEVAIVVAALAITAATWGGANQVGLWTFVVLWAMRQSAKLNLFLGVPNLAEEFLPKHLAFLESYFRRRPMNLLFPLSVTASTVVLVLIIQRAAAADASAFDVAGYTFIAALLGLAVLEHWFLVIPLPATALWRWSLRSHDAVPEPAEAARSAAPRSPVESIASRKAPIPALTATP